MKKKYLYGFLGLAIGIAISFTWTRSYNNTNAGTVPSTSRTGAGGGPASSSADQEATMGDISKTLETAKNNPKDFNAQVAAARAYAQIGQDEKAIGFLEQAYVADAKKFPEIQASGYIGQFYFEQKKYTEAETWFNRALVEDPNQPDLHTMIAETFMNREPAQPDKAIPHIQAALKLDAKNAHAMGHLIEAYALKKDVSGAEAALNKLKETEPTNNRIAALQNMVADLKAGRPVTIPKE